MLVRMLRGALTRRLLALLLLPAMLFTGTASSYSLFRCRYDAVARRSCCCPSGERPVSDAQHPSIGTSCCCDLLQVEIARSQIDNHRVERSVGDAPLATVSALLVFPTVATIQTAFPGEPVGAVGPPILLRKQSLLL